MECPICGKEFDSKFKTCSRSCGSELRFKGRDKAFWAKVYQGSPDECWPWLGDTQHTGGYGRAAWKGKLRGAHRVAFMLANGSINPALDVLHHCDKPSCCNPAHLFQGTHSDNMRDMVSKQRSADKRGRNNGRTVLTEPEVREMRELYDGGGITQSELACRFHIDQTTVSRIVRRIKWVHVLDEQRSQSNG